MTDRDRASTDQATVVGCRNPLCGYGGTLALDVYCPTCCLTPREVTAGVPCRHRGVGHEACPGCQADRLEDATGEWLPQLETRDGADRVRTPGQLFVPLDIVASPDPEVGPPWTWPDGFCAHGTPAGERCRSCGTDLADGQTPPLPGPDPDDDPDSEVDDVLARIEHTLDALHGEVRDGLGTGLKRADGARLPSELEDINTTLMMILRAVDPTWWQAFRRRLAHGLADVVVLLVLGAVILLLAVSAGLLPLMLP